MNLLLRAAAAAALLTPLAVAPATAQNYRGAWGLYGGGIWFSDLNNGGGFDNRTIILDGDLVFAPDFGVIDGDLDIGDFFGDLTLEPGWVAGTQGEYWFGNGRFGLRANGGYTERSLSLEFGNDFVVIDDLDALFFDGADFLIGGLSDLNFFDGDIVFGDVNTWLLDGDVMVRILTPRRERTWAPFVSLGAGVVIYNPAGDGAVVVPPANAVIGDVTVTGIDLDGDGDVDDLVFLGGGDNNKTQFATPIGLGTDVLPGWNLGNIGIGLRFELVDHIAWDSPADPILGTDDFDPVHNVRLTAGVMGLFGRLFPEERVAVVPPPAPPPPPAEEALSICVVDPASYDVEYVPAVFVPSTRDTLVVENGQRVDFERVYPERAPLYVAGADWYMAGRPLEVTVAGTTSEWVSYGGPRVIEPDELVFLGTVQGTPVYADRSAAALQAMLSASPTPDLSARLEGMPTAREPFDALDIVYVPLEIGCVFQPLRRVEEVRKVRG